MPNLLSLQMPVGIGQSNEPDDVERFDAALRDIGAYAPPDEYAAAPQRYATDSMVAATKQFQEQNGLKVDGFANPSGPTERAINNRLLGKPRGAGLLLEPIRPLRGTVGNGFTNDRGDVQNVQRAFGALGYLPEDPHDKPHGFIDEATTEAAKQFQSDHGLTLDGWMGPGGETESALHEAMNDHAARNRIAWSEYWDRERGAVDAEKIDETGGARTASQDFGGGGQAARRGSGREGGGTRGGFWPEPIPRNIHEMLPRQISPRRIEYKPGQRSTRLPRRQYLTNPGDPPPFDPAQPGRDLPPDSNSLEPDLNYGFTDGFDFLNWIEQQSRLHFRDRKAGVPVPGNEREMMSDWRTGFQGMPEGARFEELKFEGRHARVANRIVLNSRGNEKTQAYNFEVVKWLTEIANSHDCKVTHRAGSWEPVNGKRGNYRKETWLGPVEPLTRPDGTEDKKTGGARPDITFVAPNGARLFINTADRRGFEPTDRERNGASRILANSDNRDLLIVVPKLRQGEALNWEALGAVLSPLLDRLCRNSRSDDDRLEIFRGILQPSRK